MKLGESVFLLSSSFLALRRRLVALVIALCITAFLAVLAYTPGYFAVFRFSRELEAVDGPDKDRKIVRAGPLTAELFRDLVISGVIAFDNAALRFTVGISCAAREQGFPSGFAEKALKNRLCDTDLGSTILDEVERWNRNATTVAVRDNRAIGMRCENDEPSEYYLPDGCHPNRWAAGWSAGLNAADEYARTFATVFEGQRPAPEVYGFLARDPVAGFGDWRRFGGASGSTNVVELTTVLEPARRSRDPRTLTVDVAGDVIFAEARRGPGDAPGETPASNQVLCDQFRASEKCIQQIAEPESAHMARGHRLVFKLGDGGRIVVRLVVRPVGAVQGRIATLARATFVDPEEGARIVHNPSRTIRLTEHIVAHCRGLSPNAILVGEEDRDDVVAPGLPNEDAPPVPVCVLEWQKETAPAADAIRDNPGMLLVRTGGPMPQDLSRPVDFPSNGPSDKPRYRVVATEEAIKLGLLPIVGIDDRDSDSLLGQLRRFVPSGTEREFSLTLDPRLQASAFSTLGELMKGSERYAEISASFLSGRSADRRGAIVLLDAGAAGGGADENTGRILAAATWPQVSSGLSQWDLEAMQLFRPVRSPLAARAWSQNDRLYAPGSTFKLVIALAAIDRAARGDETVAKFLGAEAGNRGLNAAEIREVAGDEFGYGYLSSRVEVPRLSGADLRGTHSITTGSGRLCQDVSPKPCAADGRVGMRDMIARSNNLYFSRLALLLDADAVSYRKGGSRVEIGEDPAGQQGRAAPPLAIATMAERLWPAEAASLLPNEEVRRFSRLRATPIQLAETLPDGPRLLRVAENGIGQAAQATPLAMASIAASIGNGSITLPRLTEDDSPGRTMRGAPLFDPLAWADALPLDQARADAMLGTLRAGMADVVQHGTAASAFSGSPDLAIRVSGKTGTAAVSDSKTDGDTVWFVGWIDALKVEGFEERRIAFACMLTHVRIDTAAGGKTCAPLMRMLFETLEGASVASSG